MIFAHVNYFLEKIQYIVISVSFPVHIQQNDFCLQVCTILIIIYINHYTCIYIFSTPRMFSWASNSWQFSPSLCSFTSFLLTGGGFRLGVMAKAAVKKGTVLLLKAPKDSDEDRFVEVWCFTNKIKTKWKFHHLQGVWRT